MIEREADVAKTMLSTNGDIKSVNKDSLAAYSVMPFRVGFITISSDALELMKSSGLYSKIRPELALEISRAYYCAQSMKDVVDQYYVEKSKLVSQMTNDRRAIELMYLEGTPEAMWSYLLSNLYGTALLKAIGGIVNVEAFNDAIKKVEETISLIQ